MSNILDELSVVTIAGAERSMIFLSMSFLEGVLHYILDVRKPETLRMIDSIKNSKLQKYKDFKNIKYSDLKLNAMIEISYKMKIIHKDHIDVVKLFKDFRNYMHPYSELKKRKTIDIGQSQMCVGYVNHIIGVLSGRRYINNSEWLVVTGSPIYNQEINQIKLQHHDFIPTCSFAVGNVNFKHMEFNLELKDGGVFNIIYNFQDVDRFDMFRLDNRGKKGLESGYLSCHGKNKWSFVSENDRLSYTPKQKSVVKIDVKKNNFTVNIDGNTFKLNKRNNTFGFFNELKDCELNDIIFSS